VHVEDVAQAILAALEAPRETVHDQAFNVGRSQENHQVRDLAEIVRELVPGSRVSYAEGGGPDARCYRVDFSKAQESLPGFHPRWTVSDGVRELIGAFGEYGLEPDDLSSGRFIRLRRIETLQQRGSLGADLRWVRTLQRG
jgi:nucleoside-diphosphate-sugar epimerase